MAEKQGESKQGESKQGETKQDEPEQEVEVEVEVEAEDEAEAVTPVLQPQENPNNFLVPVINIVAQQQGVPILQPAQNNPMFQAHTSMGGGRNAPQP